MNTLTPPQIISNCSTLLFELETLGLDISNGLDALFVMQDLIEMYPDIDIHDPISGPKFQKFIKSMGGIGNTLPYTPFNIRGGIYCCSLGLAGEYIALYFTSKKYQNVKLLQDKDSQMNGHDISYYHNGNRITADVKVQNVDWSSGAVLKVHADWFKPVKTSVRFQIVDFGNATWFEISRGELEKLFKSNGTYIPVKSLSNHIIIKSIPNTLIFNKK